MPTPQSPPGSRASNAGSHGQLLDALRRGFVSRLQPWLVDALDAAEKDLRAKVDEASVTKETDDALSNLIVLRAHAMDYEQHWQARIGAAFDGWPRTPAKAAGGDRYALVSDDELQSQLVGQPVIEALARRFDDVIDVIDRRLWSLSATLGGQSRPGNPFAPRAVIEAFLATFPTSECHGALRGPLLRHYERIAGHGLGAVYAWCNTALSDAGHALTSAADPALLMGGSTGASGSAPSEAAKAGMWSNDNALTPTDSSWRGAAQRVGDGGGFGPPDATRGHRLRRIMRERRDDAETEGTAPRRRLGKDEFMAVLSLMQGELASEAEASGRTGDRLRAVLRQAATGLGMEADATMPSPAQEDAIDLVGALFDGLVGAHALSAQALTSLWQLAPAYLRLALEDAHAFESPPSPPLVVLSLLIEAWDANAGGLPVEAELHGLADEVAAGIANGYQGSQAVFTDAQARLQAGIAPHRKRAEVAARRAAQSIQGRERLQFARRDADQRLQPLLDAGLLLPSVATFLSDQWRQSLVQAWLRDGPDSMRFTEACAVGQAIAALDDDAAHARGHALADGLIALQAPLRDCHVACGLDESGAQSLLAQLVRDLARPDTPRARHAFTPLAGGDGEGLEVLQTDHETPAVEVGRVLVSAQHGVPQWLQFAWHSPLGGSCLLVDRQGARQQVLSASALNALLDDGRLRATPLESPAEHVLQALLASGDD